MGSKPDESMGFEKIVIGGLAGLMLLKLYENFLSWYAVPKNKLLLIVAGIGLLVLAILFYWEKLNRKYKKWKHERKIIGKDDDSVFCGVTDKNEDVWIKPAQRSMHTQVIGTTNAGKTESVILPWAIHDIHNKRGLLLIDGKADNSLLDKLWSYVVAAGREKDFRLFSLGRRDESFQFNPLLGGTAEEITERVFNSFEFENPYYRSIQYEVMNQVMRVFEATKTHVTFQRLYQAISNPVVLEDMSSKLSDPSLAQWIQWYCQLAHKDRETRTSGLLTAIGHFAFGANANLFNTVEGAITLDEALMKNQIVYFQLPVLLSPFLGKATGKLVLQSLQAAVANRHRLDQKGKKEFFSVFLDDFSEYLYPGFVSILNKSRSANVGIVFAHQALGDIQTLGDPVANSILTNSNLKVFMRGNTPDSAEYFSKVIGTTSSTKFTERQKKGRLGTAKSGDVSAREVEEFVIHPNVFKRDLGVGEAIMLIPHERGAKTVRIKFNKIDDLPPVELPKIGKINLDLIKIEQKEIATTTPTTANPFDQAS
ncbi:MAG TPA: TraM recognition domain-containing protein [Bacteriovoracaceae bacterium]|nr:TraM recognition domain-containing protein [Bacteriovoracaceae bacterium]